MKTSSVAQDYAKAFYEVCQQQQIVDEVLYEIKTLTSIHDDEIEQILQLPIISKNLKKELIGQLSQIDVKVEVINLLKILIDNDDVQLFNEILFAYEKNYQDDHDIMIIHATVAKNISNEKHQMIVQKLEKQLDKFVILIVDVNQKLIGGIKLQYDGKVIDNTILRHLEKLKNSFH